MHFIATLFEAYQQKNIHEELVTGQYMTAVSSAYAQRLVMTLFLVSFGIYLFLATVTYTPFDPGWMHISSDTQTVSNASGVAGAWISDLLFGFLGWASLLIPVYLFMEAIQVWVAAQLPEPSIPLCCPILPVIDHISIAVSILASSS